MRSQEKKEERRMRMEQIKLDREEDMKINWKKREETKREDRNFKTV